MVNRIYSVLIFAICLFIILTVKVENIYSGRFSFGLPTAVNDINEKLEQKKQDTVTVLSAPSNLQATAVSNTQIILTWTDNSDDETGFRIERKTGVSGTYTEITTVSTNVTSYVVADLLANTQYYFRLRAYNFAGDSGYSNETNATTQSGTVSTYTLTTTVSPSSAGTVTKNPDQIGYTAGTRVTLTAIPSSGYLFTNWTGSTGGISNPIIVTINSNLSITANFSLIENEDQSQKDTSNSFEQVEGDCSKTYQTFIPTKSSLTAVKLFERYTSRTGGKTTIKIYSSLTDNALTSVEVNLSGTDNGAYLVKNDWIKCDFPDITVTPGNTYYLVVERIIGMNGWGATSSNGYPQGYLAQWEYNYQTQQYEWVVYSNKDLAFITLTN